MDRFDFSAYFFFGLHCIFVGNGVLVGKKGPTTTTAQLRFVIFFFSFLFFSDGHASACTSKAQGRRAWTRAVSCQRPGYVMNVFQS